MAAKVVGVCGRPAATREALVLSVVGVRVVEGRRPVEGPPLRARDLGWGDCGLRDTPLRARSLGSELGVVGAGGSVVGGAGSTGVGETWWYG